MFKIIQNEAGKYQLKELDAAGNSVGVLPTVYESQIEAEHAAEDMQNGAPSAPVAPVEPAPAPEVPDTPNENTVEEQTADAPAADEVNE